MNFTQNVIYLNRAVSIADVGRAPDDYRHKPSVDHILCRDANGRPTAIYGDKVWDFNPYRLSAKQLTKITFESGFESSDRQFSEKLVEQVKYVLYLIIHFNRGGASGKISASTLGQYALYLKQMARFCADSLKNEVAAGVDLFDMLSNAAYMNAFLKSRERSNNLLKLTSATLGILISIGKADLGFQPISLNAL